MAVFTFGKAKCSRTILCGSHCRLGSSSLKGFAGALDSDEIDKRALKLSGNREKYVRSALGEMITYLEFELRNHPRIEDPEIYLDAVEDLRAKLGI